MNYHEKIKYFATMVSPPNSPGGTRGPPSITRVGEWVPGHGAPCVAGEGNVGPAHQEPHHGHPGQTSV